MQKKWISPKVPRICPSFVYLNKVEWLSAAP